MLIIVQVGGGGILYSPITTVHLVQVAVVERLTVYLISMPKGYLLALVVQVHLVTTVVVKEDMAVVVVLWAVVVDTMVVALVI